MAGLEVPPAQVLDFGQEPRRSIRMSPASVSSTRCPSAQRTSLPLRISCSQPSRQNMIVTIGDARTTQLYAHHHPDFMEEARNAVDRRRA